MGWVFKTPEQARTLAEAALLYLADEDGYTRQQLEEDFLKPALDEIFRVDD